MEISRLGIEPEVQLLTYATATATLDPSQICDLHHSSRQHQILNPLSGAKDWTHILMDTSHIHFCWATMGTPHPILKCLYRLGCGVCCFFLLMINVCLDLPTCSLISFRSLHFHHTPFSGLNFLVTKENSLFYGWEAGSNKLIQETLNETVLFHPHSWMAV